VRPLRQQRRRFPIHPTDLLDVLGELLRIASVMIEPVAAPMRLEIDGILKNGRPSPERCS
jgi:hypothetical protein